MNEYCNEWLASTSGEKFLQQEQQSFGRVCQSVSGQMGVQLTLNEQVNYLSGFNLSSQYALFQSLVNVDKNNVGKNSDDNSVVATLSDLPFRNNQFSVVVAPRLTLFTDDPHASLREIYRITANEGYLLLSGMNPISMIGLQAKIWPKTYPLLPTVSLKQMKVWLSLLGFNVIGGDFFHYSAMSQVDRLSLFSEKLMLSKKIEKVGNRWLPMFAGGYWLLAKKRLFGQHIVGLTKSARTKTAKMVGSVAKKF